jgi:glutamate synthase domain-containing protein 2
VHNTLVGLNLRDRVRIGAAGKLVSGFDIVRTMAMGADWCNSARGFMFALGASRRTPATRAPARPASPRRIRCVSARSSCPTRPRVFNFHQNTLKALAELVAAAGLTHPGQIRPHHIVRRVSHNEIRLLANLYDFLQPGELLDGDAEPAVFRTYWSKARPDRFEAVV